MSPVLASGAGNAPRLPLLAAGAALAYLVLLLGLNLRVTGGEFEYPLDDIYIHLAMADGIARGEYGVNAGEASAASSSPLYPVLLAPQLPGGLQRLLPLFWAGLGMLATAWLWGRILLVAGYGEGALRRTGIALALAGPIALNMPGVAYLGMEHSLHAAATLAILLGLMLALQGRARWPLFFAGVLLAPLIRFEGLAFALAAAGVLVLAGQVRRGLAAAVAATVPILAFCGFLVSLGLDALPASVVARRSIVGENPDVITRAIANFYLNMTKAPGLFLLAVAVFLLVFLVVKPERQRSWPAGLVALAVGAAIMGHLFLAFIGWHARWEHYIVVLATASVVVLLPLMGHLLSGGAQRLVLAAAMVALAAIYLPASYRVLPIGSRTIMLQQKQMGEFAKEYLQAPVAVNDIGWVTWKNPNLVFDLWGLSAPDVLHLRLGAPSPGWAAPLVEARGVKLAMIYDAWLSEAVGPEWVRLGNLVLDDWQGSVGGAKVAFYATSANHVPELTAALEAWVPTLRPGSHFDFAEGIR